MDEREGFVEDLFKNFAGDKKIAFVCGGATDSAEYETKIEELGKVMAKNIMVVYGGGNRASGTDGIIADVVKENGGKVIEVVIDVAKSRKPDGVKLYTNWCGEKIFVGTCDFKYENVITIYTPSEFHRFLVFYTQGENKDENPIVSRVFVFNGSFESKSQIGIASLLKRFGDISSNIKICLVDSILEEEKGNGELSKVAGLIGTNFCEPRTIEELILALSPKEKKE